MVVEGGAEEAMKSRWGKRLTRREILLLLSQRFFVLLMDGASAAAARPIGSESDTRDNLLRCRM